MSEKRSRSSDLGHSVARIGNRLIEFEGEVKASIAGVKEELGRMFQHFEEQRTVEEFRREEQHEPRPEPEREAIPYEPIFDEQWRREHKAWREKVISHLPSLVYVGKDEHGVPVMADFEVQVCLPTLYLIVASTYTNRQSWMKDHPYDQWKSEAIGGEENDRVG